MQRFFDIVAKYPLWIAGGVLLLVMLFWFSSRSTGGESLPVVTAFGPSEASVNANAQVQIAQMGFNAQGAANAASLEGMAIQADVTKHLAGIDASSYEKMLNTEKSITEIGAARDMDIAGKSFGTQLAMALGGFNRDIETTKIMGGTTTQVAQIQANQATSLAQITGDHATKQAEITAQLQRDQANQASAAAIAAANNAVTLEQVRGNNELERLRQLDSNAGKWWPYPSVIEGMYASNLGG